MSVAKPCLPARLCDKTNRNNPRECPAHRAWVRGHQCCVPGCNETPIECAHVRKGTDGGTGLKPSDTWVISLCGRHHSEQHRIGEDIFAAKYGLDLMGLAIEFARRSPHRLKLLGNTKSKRRAFAGGHVRLP
jgi:hypothetical protein